MNILENVCSDIQRKMQQQNYNCELYGKISNEFRMCQVVLNSTLEAYEKCQYITNYTCHYDDKKRDSTLNLYKIVLEMGSSITVYITEKSIIYKG